ncbi:hypothetical protein MJO28_002339 [Puccinia striiformis f. sp. tritici]|uniref:Secreted protein n=2 Tax=Puccinia striiformis TaxID=27350 RepID=A0A2S4VJJ9_9BASI|nr:hypothetical protein MJO28_002339 [Puccinia striiformis f. sp. tritici]POW09722.1 hypothetical protein PSHT_09004 [Puccinia striiformis]
MRIFVASLLIGGLIGLDSSMARPAYSQESGSGIEDVHAFFEHSKPFGKSPEGKDSAYSSPAREYRRDYQRGFSHGSGSSHDERNRRLTESVVVGEISTPDHEQGKWSSDLAKWFSNVAWGASAHDASSGKSADGIHFEDQVVSSQMPFDVLTPAEAAHNRASA